MSKKVHVPFAYRFYYRLHFHYRWSYRACALCVFITICVFITVAITVGVHFPLIFFTLSPAAVAENTPFQVVTMFEGRVCRAALGSGWSRRRLAE